MHVEEPTSLGFARPWGPRGEQDFITAAKLGSPGPPPFSPSTGIRVPVANAGKQRLACRCHVAKPRCSLIRHGRSPLLPFSLASENRKRGHFNPDPSTAFMSSNGTCHHAFSGNPLRRLHSEASSNASALQSLGALLLGDDGRPPHDHKVLPFWRGRPLARSSEPEPPETSPPKWRLAWLVPSLLKEFSLDSFVYLGSEDDGVIYWGVDVTDGVGEGFGAGEWSNFMDVWTLMFATDWRDEVTMGELAVAGHVSACTPHSSHYFHLAKALLEWHATSRFCGHCGARTVPINSGRRKQCTNDLCKKKIYPRVDPVVIMLIIDKNNDRALLCRPSKFVPRMWSCLSGFIEPGENLEEAVRRETWEETGIEVGEVVYHSSQPWPVGPSNMPCQLMVGFFAYAKSFNINVDKKELEDAQWYSREDVRKALTFAEYEKAQKNAADKVHQMCKGVLKGQSLSSDFNVESGELAQMFIPGPSAIAHHLISSWTGDWAQRITYIPIEKREKEKKKKKNDLVAGRL
ncbi:hypothetical protein Taro_042216 [Colocasia esculenta]|uniref:NAD(+) diphosphatase n=1 Tax=Colocasia esculenta TaxID=4460 RepID=A0A843WNX8_COLES|nr:hypothetical protein [Colocasia esculenta]